MFSGSRKNAAKFASSRKKSFRIEYLEDRRLMAGDVAAVMYGNTIYLNEAAGHAGEANAVVVSQLPNGKIHVATDTSHGSTAKVNGAASFDFTPPTGGFASLAVNFGGANDSIRILPGTNLNAVGINMSITNAGVNDVDMVDIQGLRTAGAVDIKTGDGVDNVFVQNSHIGDGVGNDDLNINTGKGWDYVQVGNTNSYNDIKGSLNIQTYDSVSETDGAVVKVQLTTARDYIRTLTNAGDDSIDLLAAVAGQDILIDAQDGKDTVTVRDSQAVDQFFVLLGRGDDSVDLNYVRANTLYADGGDGVDHLTHENDAPTNGTQFANFEYLNGFKTFQPHAAIGGIGNAQLIKA